jgi:hypothetical protein
VKPENRLPVLIFVALVALIVLPLAYNELRDRLRPHLAEARIVTATDHDPVFRDGPRNVPAGHEVEVALALRIARAGGRSGWLAPAGELELDGATVDHTEAGDWPEQGRQIRVFWFTVECTNVGGDMAPENAERRMRYRTFLAPEMGRGLLAADYPEAHNDDHLGLPQVTTPAGVGTLRFYARVEVFDPEDDFRSLQAATTLSTDRLLDPAFPAVHRAAACPDGIHAEVGELFLLPGYEPTGEPPEAWNDVTRPALGSSFTELVERRLVVSSRTFAAVALTGSPELEVDRLSSPDALRFVDGEVRRQGRPLQWQKDVEAGDLLRDGTHWTVLVNDDGNGLLDGGDAVLHCWRSPPAKTTLSEVLTEVQELELTRRAG